MKDERRRQKAEGRQSFLQSTRARRNRDSRRATPCAVVPRARCEDAQRVALRLFVLLSFIRAWSARHLTDNHPMLTLLILHGDGRVTREYSETALAAALRDPSATFWLDMLKPTEEE